MRTDSLDNSRKHGMGCWPEWLTIRTIMVNLFGQLGSRCFQPRNKEENKRAYQLFWHALLFWFSPY